MEPAVLVRNFSHDRPQNLPSVAAIIEECIAAYKAAWDADASREAAYNLRGIPLANGSAFVKFGHLEFREADIQNFVSTALSTSGRGHVRVPRVYSFIQTTIFCYIVMELIDGSTCNNTHVDQVARALEELIAIQAPTEAPGPLKLGPIDHCFFSDKSPP